MTSPSSNEALAIEHHADRGRFEAIVEGEHNELEYRLDANVMSILHTGVAPRLQGRGIAAALTRAALAHAQAAGWKVQPRCSYARSYMQRHPETASLLA